MRNFSEHEKQYGGPERVLPEDTIAINNGAEKWEHRAEVLEAAKQFAAGGGKLIHLSFPHTEVQSFGDVPYFIASGPQRSRSTASTV